MKLIGLYFKMSFKKCLQYRLNFMITCVAVAPIHLLQMIFSWFIAKKFSGFGTWSGWNLIFLSFINLNKYF